MRLEQRDSYLKAFESRVAAQRETDDATWLRLDASAFYPTSGGQPHDTGRIVHDGGEAVVLDVRHDGEGVWHRVRGSAPPTGAPLRGEIDWPRRFRHMQRHSAQHLLSQAFLRIDPRFATRSVGIASADATLDLAGEPDTAAAEAAETLVNEVAYRALPIAAFEVDEAELDAYPLRRRPKVRGRIRLVAMGDWELAACGGTHPRSTAEVAPIVVLGLERIRGGQVRIGFRAGLDALDDHRLKHRVSAPLAASFSSRIEALPERVAALRESAADARRYAAELETRLAERLASELDAAAPPGQPLRYRLEPRDAPLLDALAAALTARPERVALLGVVSGGTARLLFARGEGSGLEMNALLRAALPTIGGRGGGRPERAQGAGPDVDGLDAALDRAFDRARAAAGEDLHGGM